MTLISIEISFQLASVLQKIHREDTEAEEASVRTSDIMEVFVMWLKFSQFVEVKHPDKIATARALALCNDTCHTHFRNISKWRMKPTSLDRFILKRPASQIEESVRKRQESVMVKKKMIERNAKKRCKKIEERKRKKN